MYKSPLSHREFGTVSKSKILLDGDNAVRVWDGDKQIPFPENLKKFEVRVQQTLKVLWVSSEKFGLSLETRAIQVRRLASDLTCPFK